MVLKKYIKFSALYISARGSFQFLFIPTVIMGGGHQIFKDPMISDQVIRGGINFCLTPSSLSQYNDKKISMIFNRHGFACNILWVEVFFG